MLMRRSKFVLGALALVVATFAAFSSSAMADDLNCRDANQFERRHDADADNCRGDNFVDRSDVDFFDGDPGIADRAFLDLNDDIGFVTGIDFDEVPEYIVV
jgi:hypothetical protein